MTTFTINLNAGQLSLDDLRQSYFNPTQVSLAPTTLQVIQSAHDTVRKAVDGGATLYGINTGFGRLAQTRVETEQLDQLQKNLVLSHSTGVGEPLDEATVRLVMLLKVNSLARGHSGVRSSLVQHLIALLNGGYYPLIPARGSVGASGDLAPLAHMSCALIGKGKVSHRGEWIDSAEALQTLGLEPAELHAKEGLALLNGTQVSTALALKGLFEAEVNANAAFVTGALSVEAVLGSRVPFDARIHQVRGQEGQCFAAELYRDLIAKSEINRSHADCDKVQDPYSLRCQPQVMGACLDQMRWAASRLVIEANAVSDNPLVFPDQDAVLSGGNFHAEPVAMAADNLALVVAEVGALTERRIALLIDANQSQLPPFLVKDAGLNSGFMIAHVTAAALASENKSHAHPACVDSLPTSANQEDHVSMATFGARRLQEMNANTRHIIAIELLAAAQGITLRRPMKTSEPLEKVYSAIRRVVEPWSQDRYFATDIEAANDLIAQRVLGDYISPFIGRSFS